MRILYKNVYKYLVIFFSIIGAAFALAQNNDKNGWKYDVRSGCRYWDIGIISSQSMEWTGACPNGLVNGYGVMIWRSPNEADWRWEGYFKDGHAQRLKTYYPHDPERGYYEGDYLDGKPNGYGKMKSKSGMIYTGEFRNGDLSGEGVLTMSNGYRYEGEFKNGQANGQGAIYYIDGSIYRGYVREFKREGFGSYRGVFNYSGDWSNDQFHGRGIIDAAGLITFGKFIYGKWDGDMVSIYPSGQTMLSVFANGKAQISYLIDPISNPPKMIDFSTPQIKDRFVPVVPPK